MRSLPAGRVLSDLGDSIGKQVVLIEALRIAAGENVLLRFDGGESPWRQGVWLATEGELEVAGVRSPQLVLWQDTAPDEVRISVRSTDGVLHLYNVWDSGRGLGEFESQKATSGMLVSEDEGWLRYECSDIAVEPKFDRLGFSVRITDT